MTCRSTYTLSGLAGASLRYLLAAGVLLSWPTANAADDTAATANTVADQATSESTSAAPATTDAAPSGGTAATQSGPGEAGPPDPLASGNAVAPPKPSADAGLPPGHTSLQELTRNQDSLDIRAYRDVVAELERREGAYSPHIAEQLLALGGALQQVGRHNEAVAVFKRGVHLSRINGGLYGTEQIPLLQSEIRSYIALGDFTAADERQVYLYRVQLRTLSSGPRRANALIQQASWQQQAYELRLGEHGFNRLMNMWDLYRLALNDIMEREGDSSPDLLPPLYGMLRAQYLISDYQEETRSGFGSEYDFAERQGQSRFNAYRAQNYEKGLAVLRAIQEVEQAAPQPQSSSLAKSYIRLGDWMLWHGQDDEAMAEYQQAIAELALLADAKVMEQQLLGAPVALPDIAGVANLPPVVPRERANAVLQFDITDSGRLVDLDRVDDNEDNEAKVNRLMRGLRKTQFRPRFEGGKPVETKNVVWAYDSNAW